MPTLPHLALLLLALFPFHSNAAPDCKILVPKAPLTAQGLATPYQLLPPCTMASPTQASFVEGVIFDPVTGQLAVYNPLVITQGTQPAIQPSVLTLPPNAVVGLWFGTNANSITLVDSTGNDLGAANCVNGLPGSIFGQFAYCNAPNFFMATNRAINRGQLRIPPLGMGKDGRPCPTTRSFGVVDQDQSDNVVATYLLFPDGRTAQDTPANRQQMGFGGNGNNATTLINGSDNALLTEFMDPALGCTPFMAVNAAAGTNTAAKTMVAALALNEVKTSMNYVASNKQLDTKPFYV